MDDPEQTASRPAGPAEPYTIFDHRQRALIVLLVSVAATFSGFASNIYFPALPTIAADFHVSAELINLTVTAYLVFQGLAPSFWGPVSDARGRRVAYMGTFVVFLGACVGLALCRSYAALVVLRALQSTGSASTIAIGAGVIGDVTTRADRGGCMGVFQAGLLVPVAVGPILGGALAGSGGGALGGWRAVFWFLAIYGGAYLVVLVALLPETLRALVGNGGRAPQTLGVVARYPLCLYQKRTTVEWAPSQWDPQKTKKTPHILAPLRILASRHTAPAIVCVAVYYAVWQMSITALSTLFQTQYGLSESQTGLTYLANGGGAIAGTLVTGQLLNWDYRRQAAATTTRLQRLPLFAALQCASILMFGWTIDQHVALAAPIAATFVTGWCVVSMATCVTTYLVDVYGKSTGGGAATATASLNLARCLLAAGGTSFVTPLIRRIGTGPAFSLCAGAQALASLGFAVQQWRQQQTEAKSEAEAKSNTDGDADADADGDSEEPRAAANQEK